MNDTSSSSDAAAQRQRLEAELCLALTTGVGPRTRRALLDHFGNPSAVLAAAPNQLRSVRGVGPELSRRIAAARQEIDAAGTLRICGQHDIGLLLEDSDGYPRLLREIPDPPALLFCRGQLEPCDALAIAIVGTRHATRYGLTQAEQLAGAVARAGLTVVSGLARGIDTAAHRGALAAGGRTIAVLASGVLNVYPPEHHELAERISRQGAVVSESPPLAVPKSGAFPQRNRIISGLSIGLLVVEAGEVSGAMISARHASEQGRDVFAVPGRVDHRSSRGCHRLIRDGAKLVECVEDVLDELGPLVEAAPSSEGHTIRHPCELQLNEQERSVLDSIEDQPTAIDTVIQRSGLPAHRVLSTVSVLEVRRLVRRLSGQLVART